MLSKQNLMAGVVAGLVAATTLLLVGWAVTMYRQRQATSGMPPSKTPCGCGGH